jgi:hypothetical protein
MIIYEVNVEVEPSLSEKYLAWLRGHIGEMKTQLCGIQRVAVSSREAAADGWASFTIIYTLNSREDLDDYISNRSARMRQQAVDAFGTNFRASRRIMTVLFEE